MRTYTAHCIYGCFEKYVKVTVDKVFEKHKNAQCGIIENENGINLISYETLICTIDKNDFLSFSINPNYSRTTATHVGWFLEEYAPNIPFNICKFCYKNEVMINIKTGEIRPLFEYENNDYDFEERD